MINDISKSISLRCFIVIGFLLTSQGLALTENPSPSDAEQQVPTQPDASNSDPETAAGSEAVTERAVPGVSPRPGTSIPTIPSVGSGSQAASPLAGPQPLSVKGPTPSCPPPAVTGLGQ